MEETLLTSIKITWSDSTRYISASTQMIDIKDVGHDVVWQIVGLN